MPELPEVETVCRLMRHTLVGKVITEVGIVPDRIVFFRDSPQAFEAALRGRKVQAVGRRGKTFWVTLGGPGPILFGHLGMSGWIRVVGPGTKKGTRLQGHGNAPFDDAEGHPRFMRLRLQTSSGNGIVFTDARRLGRLWLGDTPESEPRIARLGADAFDDLPTASALAALLARRHRTIKAVLLDQTVLAGIGNWVADEVLYQARIAPAREAAALSKSEVSALRRAIRLVLDHAVSVGADADRYPDSWLFAHRWGGARGSQRIGRHPIVRETIGGRTTAWVPARQRESPRSSRIARRSARER